MRHSLERARVVGSLFPSLVLAWLVSTPTTPAAPFLALRPGPIDRPLSIAAADFDRDGYDDLAIANFQAGTIQILINRHDGTFAPAPGGPFGVGAATFSSQTAGPFDMVVTDLNPEDVDGDSVANTDDNCPNVFNPVVATSNAQLDTDGNGVGDACQILGDTDCDGSEDDPIDTDQDGVPDYDPSRVPPLDNCPRMPNPPNPPNSMQDDTDGDGVGDACTRSLDLIVVTNTQGGQSPFGAIRVRLNDGAGGLVARPSYGSGVAPGNLVVGDFTGDLRPDFAVAVSSVDLMQFLPGQADGLFGNSTVLHAGDGAQGAAAGDFDGDGDLDLAVANRTADSLSIFLNSGTALPTTATSTLTLAPQSGPVVLLSGTLGGASDRFADLVVLSQGRPVCAGGPKVGAECDLDADCADPLDPFMVFACTGGSGSFEVYQGSAAGVLTATQPRVDLGPGHRPRAGLLRDLNGDGLLDLAVGDFTGGQVLLYAGAGDGTFAAAGSLIDTPSPTSLAAFHLVPGPPGLPDLAVLDYANNRIDLYRNDGGGSFSLDAASPAAAWRDPSAMLLTAADSLVAVDIVLLQRAAARVDALSGIGDGSFRAVSPRTLTGPFKTCPAMVNASGIVDSDLRQDGRPDLAVLDSSGEKVTVLTSGPFGTLDERETVPAGAGASNLKAGTLVMTIDDYDRDGVPNVLDDCPTVYNPPLCTVNDPTCPRPPVCAANDPACFCSEPALAPTTCDALDPATQQCDTDRNGIGDHCQILPSNCLAQDSDLDSKPDYNPSALTRSFGELDFDGDGVPNAVDNCPNVVNPIDTSSNMQPDVDGNGVGDACATLIGGLTVDPDGDGVPTFDPAQAPSPPAMGSDPVGDALDNCPSIYNPGQEDNDGDHIGNACVIRAALDNCVYTFNLGQDDLDGDGVGDPCAVPPQDLIVANSSMNKVTLLAGDGTGGLHMASASPLTTGLTGPKAGVTGHFALNCVQAVCFDRIPNDVAVVAEGAAGTFTVTVFKGDGLGGFPARPPAVVSGDSNDLLVAAGQPVCRFAGDPTQPLLRFDIDDASDILAAVEPGASKLQVLLGSNKDVLTPGASPLVPPVAQPQPLGVPAPLVTALFEDLNQDGLRDLVALSSPVGGDSLVTIYLGIGNGLFFTDPTFSPVTVPGEASLMAATNVNLKTDEVLPEVVLFSKRDQAPVVLTNILAERADIDGSRRVDGFDLALLAASFGADRGEDFMLQADGTLAQGGPSCDLVDRDFHCLVTGGGSPVPGQDLPALSNPMRNCDTRFEPLTGPYGLAMDINLDGMIDGKDLAYLASLFGQRLLPP